MKKIVSIIIYPVAVFLIYLLSITILSKVPNSFLCLYLGPCENCPLGAFCDCYQYIFLGQEISGGAFLFLNLLFKFILPIPIGIFFALLFNVYVFRNNKNTNSKISNKNKK